MGISEFDESYEDDDALPSGLDGHKLGEAILGSTIRSLEPRPAVCVHESTTIRDAIRLMLEKEIGAVLVEQGSRAAGIFTERDVLRRVVASGIDLDRPVSEVMTADPETLGPDDGIAFALNKMILGGFRHVPIVDEGGAALAVLSLREVVAFIVSLLPKRVMNLPPDPKLEAHSTDGG